MKVSKDISNSENIQNVDNTSKKSDITEKRFSDLEPGDRFKATITDIQPNRISLRLGSGESLSARSQILPDARIGEESIFLVKENFKGQILLEMMKPDNNAMQNNIIKEALQASGLYATGENIELVRELIKNGMPLDAATMQKAAYFKYIENNMDLDKVLFLLKEDFPSVKKSASTLNSVLDKSLTLSESIKGLAEEILNIKDRTLQKNILNIILAGNTKKAGAGDLIEIDEKGQFFKIKANGNEHVQYSKEQIYKELMGRFFIDLKDEKSLNNLNKFYNDLNNAIKEAGTLVKTENTELTTIAQRFENVNDVLKFMEQVSSNREYMQIPLIISGNEKQGDLYVFKDGKKNKDYKAQASVLIALDFENLGHVEVFINKAYNDLNIQFRLEDDQAIKLLNQNMGKFSQTLSQKGYSLSNFSIKKLNERFSLMHNIDAPEERPVNKRYTFDMRV